jgi:hypothetical protein
MKSFITVLSESGFEARHIFTISGHKNEQRVHNYVRDTSNAPKTQHVSIYFIAYTVVSVVFRKVRTFRNIGHHVSQGIFA